MSLLSGPADPVETEGCLTWLTWLFQWLPVQLDLSLQKQTQRKSESGSFKTVCTHFSVCYSLSFSFISVIYLCLWLLWKQTTWPHPVLILRIPIAQTTGVHRGNNGVGTFLSVRVSRGATVTGCPPPSGAFWNEKQQVTFPNCLVPPVFFSFGPH